MSRTAMNTAQHMLMRGVNITLVIKHLLSSGMAKDVSDGDLKVLNLVAK